MRWNWQQPDWPAFSYASDALEPLERRFLLAAGELIGAFRHVGRDDHDQLRVELIVDEALKTSGQRDAGEAIDWFLSRGVGAAVVTVIARAATKTA